MAIDYNERYQIYITNQSKRIGAGYRIVDVKVGRKWVYLKTVHDNESLVDKQKITMRAWQEILKYPQTKKLEGEV